MPRRIDIPEPFRSRPFRVADAKRAGLSQKLLDGPQFRRPFHGVRIPASLPDTLHVSCQAVALAVTADVAFSHETAALLCRLPVPRFDGDVDISAAPGAVVPRMRGVDGHTGLDPATVTVVGGLPIVHPERTFVDLAATLELDDLVAFGDAVLRRGSSPEHLASTVASLPGRRGIVRARKALGLVSSGVDSPMETRVRLLMLRAGLPVPETNVDVVDDSGAWLARPDLAYPELKIAIEYDGDHHRTDKRQWRRDRFRDERMRDAGWIVITLTADDVLRYPQRTVERIRAYVATRFAGRAAAA